MSKQIEKTSDEKPPEIIRGRVSSFAVYEVTDSELATLEKGAPGSLYLTFATNLVSIAVCFLVALLSPLPAGSAAVTKTWIVFCVITVVGFCVGLFLLILWVANYRRTSSITKAIRARLPSEAATAEQGEGPPTQKPALQSKNPAQ
jgi:hypothetical protein